MFYPPEAAVFLGETLDVLFSVLVSLRPTLFFLFSFFIVTDLTLSLVAFYRWSLITNVCNLLCNYRDVHPSYI